MQVSGAETLAVPEARVGVGPGDGDAETWAESGHVSMCNQQHPLIDPVRDTEKHGGL